MTSITRIGIMDCVIWYKALYATQSSSKEVMR